MSLGQRFVWVEIIDLQNFLNRMGTKISGAGTSCIRIQGVKNLKNTSYNIMPDRIEIGTFLCMAAVTGGNILIKNVRKDDIKAIVYKLEETGANVNLENNQVKIAGNRRLKAIEIKTLPYPGFPTDMQSVFGAMLTVAKGTSVIVENIFDNRFKYINELKKMGAKAIEEGNVAVIKGTRKLHPAQMTATDLRGGAAMCTAALASNGISTISNIEYILRGYENFEKKLNSLNANIRLAK